MGACTVVYRVNSSFVRHYPILYQFKFQLFYFPSSSCFMAWESDREDPPPWAYAYVGEMEESPGFIQHSSGLNNHLQNELEDESSLSPIPSV